MWADVWVEGNTGFTTLLQCSSYGEFKLKFVLPLHAVQWLCIVAAQPLAILEATVGAK